MKKAHELFVCDATSDDYEDLAASIRYGDSEELIALSGKGHSAVKLALDETKCSTRKTYSLVTSEGELAAVYGIGRTRKNYLGIIWILGTHCLDDNKIAMGLISRLEVPRISEGYDMVYNFVYSRNKHANRWMDSLGFTLISNHSSLSFLDGSFRLYGLFLTETIKKSFTSTFDPDELDRAVLGNGHRPAHHIAHQYVASICNWR